MIRYLPQFFNGRLSEWNAIEDAYSTGFISTNITIFRGYDYCLILIKAVDRTKQGKD